MELRDGDARRKHKGIPAPPERKRGKPSAAAPPVRMGPGDGVAPTARRRGRPTGAAAPPSLAPPPSMRMGRGDGSAPTGRRRKCHAAPASLVPAPSVRTARGNGDGDATRKRKESSSPSSSPSKRGRRTHSERRSSSSAGGSGGGLESYAGEDDEGTEGSAGEEGVAGRGDDPDGSGEGGAGHTTHGPPPADPAPPGAPPKNAVHPQGGRVSVAHTPNIPPRFEGLIRNITSLVPCESKGKSYECRLDQVKYFLNWTKSDKAFFFEWSDEEMEMNCWMHNIKKRNHIKFTVNAAFSHEMDSIEVQRAAVAFSTNFSGDEYWLGVKDMLSNMFGSVEDESLKEYDYLYVFTRVGDSVFFRNFEIISLPKANDLSSPFVLTEINTTFCLKLVSDQVIPKSSDIGPDITKNEPRKNLSFCQVTLYSNSDRQTGSCLSHDVDISGKICSFLLENGCYISSLESLDGFNTSLAEIVVKEPLLKVKHIIGSLTNKTYCFARKRCKSILQSLFAEFATLLESGRCISETGQLFMHNVLVRGTTVRLYGVDLTDYTEHLATRTVKDLVHMVRKCFPIGKIPLDLYDLLNDLENNPLDGIRIAKDDCSVLKAEDRRTLLINTNSEYMTNVEEKPSEPDHINEITFFEGCPYADDWSEIMEDNEYMVQVCNLPGQENLSDEDKDASVMQSMKKKVRIGKITPSIKKFAKKKKLETNKGKLQFSFKRNFHMRMPEMARRDGIIPFRLGMADYILTAYFPRFLRFVQKRMRDVKAQRGTLKK